MSNAIGQSATDAAVTLNGEANHDFLTAARDAAVRQAKGVTRERQMLNRQKLIQSVCSDFRMHFAEIYGKTDRLPSDIFAKVTESVDAVISEALKTVNHTNIISHRRAFYHDSKNMLITERVQLTGENQITLQEQHLGITLFIGQAEKRLKDLQAKKTPDYEREKEVKAQLMKLTVTQQFIDREIENQKKLEAK